MMMINLAHGPAADELKAMDKNRSHTFGQNDKLLGRKKLSLTPELRRPLPFVSSEKNWSYRLFGTGGFGFLRTALEANVEMIAKNVLAERKRFQSAVDGLRSQVERLEAKNREKTAEIEDMQLCGAEKLKIIDSLAEALDDAEWKEDAMRRLCEEREAGTASHLERPWKRSLMVGGVVDRLSVFECHRDGLRSRLTDLEGEDSPLAETVRELAVDLDECMDVFEEVAADSGRPCSDGDGQRGLPYDFDAVVETIDRLRGAAARNDGRGVQPSSGDGDESVALWDVTEELFRKNRRLVNRVASLNVHRAGLRTQLDDTVNGTRELERRTATEVEVVARKRETLRESELLVQQHWDELDTSREIVERTRMAQEIDREVEDLQIEFHGYDQENKQLKTDLSDFKNELNEYQLKCEQLDKENKRLESEKSKVLEAYAKSWGHYNEKQKIKYTAKLVKDINIVTQEIRSYEVELEKYEPKNVNSPVRTPVFSKTQPKSEKTPRTFGVIDINKQPKTGVFRDNAAVRNYNRY